MYVSADWLVVAVKTVSTVDGKSFAAFFTHEMPLWMKPLNRTFTFVRLTKLDDRFFGEIIAFRSDWCAGIGFEITFWFFAKTLRPSMAILAVRRRPDRSPLTQRTRRFNYSITLLWETARRTLFPMPDISPRNWTEVVIWCGRVNGLN